MLHYPITMFPLQRAVTRYKASIPFFFFLVQEGDDTRFPRRDTIRVSQEPSTYGAPYRDIWKHVTAHEKKKRKRKEKRRARQKKGERKKRREKKEIRARIGLAVKPENPANFVMKIRGNRQLGLAPRTRIAPRGRCTMIRAAEAQARTHRYGYAAKGTVKGCSARARPPKQCASVVNEVLLMQTRSPRLF